MQYWTNNCSSRSSYGVKILNKADLIREIYEHNGKKVSMKDLEQIIDAMLNIISEKLKGGEEVQLAEFGTFALSKFAVKPAEVHTRKQKV